MTLEQQAVNAVKAYRSNKIIMDFVTKEALEKTAEEIRGIIKGGTTAKGALMLSYKNKNIAARIEEYVTIGLIGCFMATLN